MCFEVKYLGIGGRGFPYRKQNRETLHLRRAGTRLSGRHREVRHLRDGLRMERKREKYASWRLSRRPEGGGSVVMSDFSTKKPNFFGKNLSDRARLAL